MTSKSSFLVGSVTENLVSTEGRPVYACPTKIYKQEVQQQTREEKGNQFIPVHGAVARAVRLSTLPLEGKSLYGVFSVNGQRNVAIPRGFLKNPLRAA